MAALTEAADWVLAAEFDGRTRYFNAADMPLSIGGSDDDDITIGGVLGSIRVGVLDGAFFLSPERGTRNLRIDGQSVAG
ncbi:MAG TPA: hypothetical protein VFY39_05400, partial [Gammaproteobacteria bacterium]|nr:hypothetical protein [Gammaproteobacteria bacterium]